MKEKGIKVTRIPLVPPRLPEIINKGISISIIFRLLAFYFVEILTVVYTFIRNNTRLCMIRHSIPTLPLASVMKLLRIRSIADGEILSTSIECKMFFPPNILKIMQLFENMRLYSFLKVMGKDHLHKLLEHGFSREKIILTRIAIDTSSIPLSDLDAIPPATFGYFGILAKWQGLSFLIRSFSKVVKKSASAKLFIIGDGPLKKELEDLTESLKLGGNVIFCGAVQRAALHKDVFKLFRVVVIPRPKLEGLAHTPMKLVEALAAGKPVIATAVGGFRELEGKGVSLVQPGNENDMARVILQLAKDDRLLRTLSQQASEAAQQYDITAQVEKILTVVG
jgi:glycosyltransferase involved in cell wall biosynthesis